MAKVATTSLPLGTVPAATVPLFNVWTMWWNADRLLHGFNGYWDAPIFHPLPGAFAFSEPQPATLVVAPIIWLTGSRALAYNVYVWLSLVLNAVFAHRLLRLQGVRWLPAFIGGAAMLLLPIVHWQRDVLQLIPVWGILWMWAALLGISRERSLHRGGELGIAFAVTFCMCVHHGLFGAVLLAGTFWILGKRLLSPGTWLALAVASGLAVVLLAHMLLPMQRIVEQYEFARSPEIVMRLSATPADYATSSGTPLIDPGFAPQQARLRLAPGWIKLGLTFIALIMGLWRKRWRRWSLFLLATGTLAFVCSTGLRLEIHGWQPWSTISAIVPGLAQARNVFRFAYFVQMVTVLGAAQCLYFLLLLSRRFSKSESWRAIAHAAVLVLGVCFVFETVPSEMTFARAPDAIAHSRWIAFIRDETPAGRSVACIPFAAGDKTSDFETTTESMYFGTYHHVPLVNGYSGFFPQYSSKLRRQVNDLFPDQEVLRHFVEADVEFVILTPSEEAVDMQIQRSPDEWTLQLAFEDPVGVRVYRLVRWE